MLEENDDKSFKSDYNSGTSEDCDTADGHFQNLKQMPKKWGKTKKKKKMPKKIFNIIKNSDDGELDLHIRSLDNLQVSAETVKFIRERDLFKVGVFILILFFELQNRPHFIGNKSSTSDYRPDYFLTKANLLKISCTSDPP